VNGLGLVYGAISAYMLRRGVLDTTLCDNVRQWYAAGRWISPVSTSNKTDRHDIIDILLNVALNTINQT
jgi:hypothetical protein